MVDVLLVEDDLDQQEVMLDALEADGLRVEVVQDGEEAIERLAISSPRVLMLDLILPGMMGWKLIHLIRQSGIPVPIIVCSAWASADLATHLRQLGVAAFFRKPLDLRELLPAIHRLAAGPDQQRSLARAQVGCGT